MGRPLARPTVTSVAFLRGGVVELVGVLGGVLFGVLLGVLMGFVFFGWQQWGQRMG